MVFIAHAAASDFASRNTRTARKSSASSEVRLLESLFARWREAVQLLRGLDGFSGAAQLFQTVSTIPMELLFVGLRLFGLILSA